MKVRDLIELLSQLDPDHMVVMSKDAEGNGFSRLNDYDIGQFEHGFWQSSSIPADDGGCEPECVNAILLWPTD